jgi:hypothetical protein
MSMNSYSLFQYLKIQSLFLSSNFFLIYFKKKLESFLFDPSFLLEFICYNFLYHTSVPPCFGSLLYALKPIITSPHNICDHVLSALLIIVVKS